MTNNPGDTNSGRLLSVQTAVVAAFARLIRSTCRLRISDRPGVLNGAAAGPFIFVCWHNRLLFFPPCAPRGMRKRTRVLTSISRDGESAARYIRHFGIESIRGSSSRGGFKALVQLKRSLSEGTHVFLTPDGPRGPRYCVQPGTVLLARKSGAAVAPVCLNASRYWELNGWDRTQIAKPFSTLELAIGDLIPAEQLLELSVDEARNRVSRGLLSITRDCAGEQSSSSA